jgi:C4-dicarboxylate-specific signal transduction histidine kinase
MAAEPEALPPLRNGDALAPADPDPEHLQQQVEDLQIRVRRAEERRRALLHIMGDLNESNRKLEEQRKAMLHILADYEQDRSSLAQHTERLDNSRRALLNILKDSHESNLRLGETRKAMIHIMGDLRETTQAVERREQELRDKQEQLVQAAKLATLGELTTGVAHELNNPLNNIGLFVGNVIDRMMLGELDLERVVSDLEKAMDQVRKATEIITHLRTFGRAAPISLEPVAVGDIIERSLSLMNEQLRVREINVDVEPAPDELVVLGNAIQLEQVFINLLTNARDALVDAPEKTIRLSSALTKDERVSITVSDTGPGIPPGLEQRIFDPFFTTKEVGMGTGLGLSITYGIVREHDGTIDCESAVGQGTRFTLALPLAPASASARSARAN